MGKLLKQIFLVDLFQGLWVTFRNQHPKYIYTEQYPAERPKVAERYRGAPRLNINPDNGETLCISCNLCALACPETLIVVTSQRNEETKRKELTTFTYDTSRCMFCGLCEDACPTDALDVPPDLWKHVKISAITIDTERCITYRDVECGVCAHACPAGETALRIDDQKHPRLGPDCTGCGVCVVACVTSPSSIKSTTIGRPS